MWIVARTTSRTLNTGKTIYRDEYIIEENEDVAHTKLTIWEDDPDTYAGCVAKITSALDSHWTD
jgi:hypothetical protein